MQVSNGNHWWQGWWFPLLWSVPSPVVLLALKSQRRLRWPLWCVFVCPVLFLKFIECSQFLALRLSFSVALNDPVCVCFRTVNKCADMKYACDTFVLPHKVLVIVDVSSKICVFGLAVVFGLIESRVFCRWPWQEKSGWSWSFTGHHSMSLSKTARCALCFSRGRALRHCEEQWTIKSRFKWDDLDQLKWMCLHWTNG